MLAMQPKYHTEYRTPNQQFFISDFQLEFIKVPLPFS